MTLYNNNRVELKDKEIQLLEKTFNCEDIRFIEETIQIPLRFQLVCSEQITKVTQLCLENGLNYFIDLTIKAEEMKAILILYREKKEYGIKD